MKLGVYLAIFAASASALQAEVEVGAEAAFFLPAWTRIGTGLKDTYGTRRKRDRKPIIDDTSSSESSEEDSD